MILLNSGELLKFLLLECLLQRASGWGYFQSLRALGKLCSRLAGALR